MTVASTVSTEEIQDVMQSLNEHQAQALLCIARQYAEFTWANEASITALDERGYVIEATGEDRAESLRISFDVPADSARDMSMAIMALALDADKPDGRIRVSTATVETEKATRYLKALCNHFGRKVDSSYKLADDQNGTGRVEFGFGVCELDANERALTMTAGSESDLRQQRTQNVIASHLVRFMQDADLELTWRELPSEPATNA